VTDTDNELPQSLRDTMLDFAYVIPRQGFVYKENGEWRLDTVVSKEAILHYLISRNWRSELANALLRQKAYLTVTDIVMEPNQPVVFERNGNRYINTWVASDLSAKTIPGDKTWKDVAPRIFSVLDFLTGHDKDGLNWLIHWIALKVQNPGIVPKIAVVSTTEPGGGKGTIASVIFHMLGKRNCAVVERDELENKFNTRWVQKLFVLADEVLSSENMKDVSDRLKLLIDSAEIKLEGKGRDQRSVPNRLAWLFASNDKVTPVRVDNGDRRYTVFTNHEPVGPEYRAMLISCFDPIEREKPTPDFLEEIQYFYWHCLNLVVDRRLLSFPYRNEARQLLIDANKPAHETFFDEVNSQGIDGLLERVLSGSDFELMKAREDHDFGTNGVSKTLLYKAYQEHCNVTGSRGMKYNKFCGALKHGTWDFKQNLNRRKVRVDCYKVPRQKGG
jgi:hypothetical protein